MRAFPFAEIPVDVLVSCVNLSPPVPASVEFISRVAFGVAVPSQSLFVLPL